MIARLDIKNFVKETTCKILDEHFNQKELKDLLKFLNSSTGKKLVDMAPSMAEEGVDMALEHCAPILIDFLKELRPHSPFGASPSPHDQELIDKLKKMIHDQHQEKVPPL
jgi:hypothetical protein